MQDRIYQYEPLWGEWKVDELIGEGSFGKVYKVKRTEFGEDYYAAVKLITIPQSETEIKHAYSEGMDEQSVKTYFENFVSGLLKEIRLMSSLKGNTNIVSLEDYKITEKKDGIGWDILIRMELLKSFMDYMAEKTLSKRDIIKLGIDMCKALELCQKANIIHRDIKPDNIFVSPHGDFKLGDFGIARQIEKTTSGLSKKGTFTYMAPEVYKGEAYNSTVDIYSLGLVLYRLLNNNRTPFLPDYPAQITHTSREESIIRRISGEMLTPPINADGRLAEIVLKACSYKPKDRYENPILMREALESIQYEVDEAPLIYPKGDKVVNQSVNYVSANEPAKAGTMTESLFGQSIPVPMVSVIENEKTGSIYGQPSNEQVNDKTEMDKTASIFGNTTQQYDKTASIYKPLTNVPENLDNQNSEGYVQNTFTSSLETRKKGKSTVWMVLIVIILFSSVVLASNYRSIPFMNSLLNVFSPSESSTNSKSSNDYVNHNTSVNSNTDTSTDTNIAISSDSGSQVKMFNVIFKSYDGKILKTQAVAEGNGATAPDVMKRDGYTFTGWDTVFNKVTSELVVTATYSKNGEPITANSYNVVFKDYNGTILQTQKVNSGSGATPPANPSRTGYAFTGWDKTYFGITSDLTVTATYSINIYVVVFSDFNGTVLASRNVEYNNTAVAPINPTRTGYTFAGWDATYNNITSNKTITAMYSINTYSVTFTDYNGTVLKQQSINYGNSATAPANPSRSGYTFVGWNKSFSSVTSDLTVVATYTAIVYPAPSTPSLSSPANQQVFCDQSFPTLYCSSVSSPSGSAILYLFEVTGPQNGNSGWISATSWNPYYGSNGVYSWKVKSKDSLSGLESGWSSILQFKKSASSYGLSLSLQRVEFGPYDSQGNNSDKTQEARNMISGNSVTINATDSFFFTSGDPGPSFTKRCRIVYRNQWNEEYEVWINENQSITINNNSRTGSFLLDADTRW